MVGAEVPPTAYPWSSPTLPHPLGWWLFSHVKLPETAPAGYVRTVTGPVQVTVQMAATQWHRVLGGK